MAAKFSETVVNTVRELERERFRAMVEADGEQLDALLSDAVSYIHTNGKRETKTQFLAAVTSGKRRYRQIEAESDQVTQCLVHCEGAAGQRAIRQPHAAHAFHDFVAAQHIFAQRHPQPHLPALSRCSRRTAGGSPRGRPHGARPRPENVMRHPVRGAATDI